MSRSRFLDNREAQAEEQGDERAANDRSVRASRASGFAVCEPQADFLRQFRRPERKLFLPAFVDFFRGLIVASQQFARIEHAIDQHFSSKSLFDDDRHLVAHGISRALGIAEKRGSLFTNLLVTPKLLIDDVEKELLQRV